MWTNSTVSPPRTPQITHSVRPGPALTRQSGSAVRGSEERVRAAEAAASDAPRPKLESWGKFSPKPLGLRGVTQGWVSQTLLTSSFIKIALSFDRLASLDSGGCQIGLQCNFRIEFRSKTTSAFTPVLLLTGSLTFRGSSFLYFCHWTFIRKANPLIQSIWTSLAKVKVSFYLSQHHIQPIWMRGENLVL